MPVNNLIQLRKGSATEWNLANPVLASGEAGYDLTNKVLKIGDGVTNWNNLTNHQHTSSNITDFNTSVSGLLPSISGSGYVNSSFNNNVYTISITGVQPSGQYATAAQGLLAETAVQPSDVLPVFIKVKNTSGGIISAGTPIYTTGSVGDTDVATIAIARADDPNKVAVAILDSTLSNNGTGNATVIGELTNINTTSLSKGLIYLAPSGGLTNTKPSDPLHFVQWLGSCERVNINTGTIFVNVTAPRSPDETFVTNILGGNNVSVAQSGTVFTVAVTGSLGLTTEEVDDRVSNLLIAGSGISLNYDDNSNSLTVAVSGLSNTINIGDGNGNVITFNTSETLNVVGSGSTTVEYNDTTNTINISSPSLIREYELVNSNKSTFTVTGGYALNNLDVYHNGIKLLASGDYTATNGTSFTLIQPAVSGDVVEWLGYSVVPRHQLILAEVRSDTVNNVNYIGRAVAGSSESSSVWSVKRYTVADNGIDISTASANNIAWTNHLSATYI